MTRISSLPPITYTNASQDLKEFIHILTAISLLPGHKMGWDPTLQLFDTESKNFNFSYQIRPSQSGSVANLPDNKWLLSLVDEWKTPSQEHKIILAGTPLLIRSAEGMNGRAVQVHRGYLEGDEYKTYRVSTAFFIVTFRLISFLSKLEAASGQNQLATGVEA